MARGKRIVQIGVTLLACLAVPGGMIYRLRQQDQHERALIAAVVAGNEQQVRVELRWGISPNTRDVPNTPTDWREYIKRLLHRQPLPNQQQYTPALLLAEQYKFHAISRLLLQAGADPNATDSTNKRPLMRALGRPISRPQRGGSDEATALLMLAKGADPNSHDDAESALEAAVYDRERDVARELILRGANVNARASDGDTLLPHATFDLYLTGLMLQRGANINAADADGDTVLMLADEEMTPLLLARGANINAKDVHGYTALRYAGDHEEQEKIRGLLRYGADCNPTHNSGWNLLCWSVAHGHRNIARMASARGIGVNTRNGFERTPLMFAASKGDVATMRWLLAQGANVNVQDKSGMTALMYAAQEDKALAVQLLLQHGANARLRDREHKWTALQFAQNSGSENAVAVFPAHSALPPLPADTNPKGNAKRSRVRVDANHWLIRTRIARKDDPLSAANEYVEAYAVRLIDDKGRQGTPVVVHQVSSMPAMFAFRDVDRRHYVYVEEREDIHPGGAIYLVKSLQLFRKWSGANRFGLNCTPLPGGGALISRYAPGHYEYGWHSPRTRDATVDVSRFRNGVVKVLGTLDIPDE